MKNARALLLLISLPLFACTRPQAAPPDTTPTPAVGAERVAGTVKVVGSAPVNVQVVIQPREGRSVRLVGPLREELARLAGAEVAVGGATEPSPDPMSDRQIRVADYEILAVDGQPVISGTVEGTINGWTVLRTPGGELVYLASAPEQFRAGQKVWVQGPRSVVVQSYGVLRP